MRIVRGTHDPPKLDVWVALLEQGGVACGVDAGEIRVGGEDDDFRGGEGGRSGNEAMREIALFDFLRGSA